MTSFLALAILGFSLGGSFHAGGIPPSDPLIQQGVPDELKETANKFMTILEKGQPGDLLGLVSRKGVVFGIESDPISVSRIRVEIQEKRGVYCLLFDTGCFKAETLQEWKRTNWSGNIEAVFSLREALTSAPEKKINIISDGRQGWVSWKLKLNGRPGEGSINWTNFGFALEQKVWKLTSVGYPGYR